MLTTTWGACAVFVGHDWGGGVVWSMAAHHTDRVQAVAGISTPYMRRAPMDPMEIFKQAPDGRCVALCGAPPSPRLPEPCVVLCYQIQQFARPVVV